MEAGEEVDKTGKREQTQDSKREGVTASQRLKVNENRTEEMPAWLKLRRTILGHSDRLSS